jgi:hypothetical protein
MARRGVAEAVRGVVPARHAASASSLGMRIRL